MLTGENGSKTKVYFENSCRLVFSSRSSCSNQHNSNLKVVAHREYTGKPEIRFLPEGLRPALGKDDQSEIESKENRNPQLAFNAFDNCSPAVTEEIELSPLFVNSAREENVSIIEAEIGDCKY